MRLTAMLMLVLLTGIWGMTFPATKSALDIVTPMQFLAVRFLIGAMLFLPWFIIGQRRRAMSISGSLRRYAVPGVLIGLLLLIGFSLQATGMKFTTASRSGFFTGLLTLIVPLLAMIFKTSRSSLAVWLALPVALSGIYLLSDPDLGGLNQGDILTIACAFVFALQMITLEYVLKNDDNRDATDALTFIQIVVVGIGCAFLALFEGAPITFTPKVVAAALYTAIFGSSIAVWIQTRYQPMIPAGHAGMIFTLEPLWAALFAWWLLDDVWTSRGLMGAGLILVAMAVSSLGMKDEG